MSVFNNIIRHLKKLFKTPAFDARNFYFKKIIKLRNFFLSILILISFNSYCQSELDSIYVSPRKQRLINDPLTPSKAAFYSSVIPGLGQVYTRRYWMVPIIYGGLGTSAYYFNYNQKEMNKYRTAYKRRLAGYFDDEYIDLHEHLNICHKIRN